MSKHKQAARAQAAAARAMRAVVCRVLLDGAGVLRDAASGVESFALCSCAGASWNVRLEKAPVSVADMPSFDMVSLAAVMLGA